MMARLIAVLIEACRLAVSGDAVLAAIDLADLSPLEGMTRLTSNVPYWRNRKLGGEQGATRSSFLVPAESNLVDS